MYFFCVQVQKEGLFSLDFPFGYNQTAIIFPFWPRDDTFFNTSLKYFSGSVKYLEIRDGPELERLSSLISVKQGVNFVGNWALVAEWREIRGYTYRIDVQAAVSAKY